MLTLTGTLKTATTIGGGINRKTNQPVPIRSIVQVEVRDDRGLAQVHTIGVPDHRPFEPKVGETVTLPVRAWAVGVAVNFAYGGEQ